METSQSSQSYDKIANAFERAYREQREAIINKTILAKLKLDLDTYQRHGYGQLGPEVHADIYRKIEAVKVGVEFLVYGYDEQGYGHIFTIDDSGEAQSLETEGFGTIGVGWSLAHASLVSRPLQAAELDDMIYRVCEAKFAAESALGVGLETVVSHYRAGCSVKYLPSKYIAQLHRFWDRERSKALPRHVRLIVQQALSEATEPLARRRP